MRLIEDQYMNNAGTLRIRTEYDQDASNPRKDSEQVGTLVADHSRYDMGDEDAKSDLNDALQAIAPDGVDIEDEMLDCPICHGDEVHDEEGELHLEDDQLDWDDCRHCRGTGIQTTHQDPQDNVDGYLTYLGENDDGTWYVRCVTCAPLAAHGKPGKVPVCRECQGEGEIDNPYYADTSDGPGLLQALNKLDPNEEKIFRLPVFMYEHSGRSVSTKAFSCQWDSGQLGFIWVTLEQATRELGQHDGSLESIRNAAHRCMEGEIEVYNMFVSNEVYGYMCEHYTGPEGDDKDTDDDSNWEEKESCWGFFGMDIIENGMIDHWSSEYQEAFCEAEGITLEQLKAEQTAWRDKVLGKVA